MSNSSLEQDRTTFNNNSHLHTNYMRSDSSRVLCAPDPVVMVAQYNLAATTVSQCLTYVDRSGSHLGVVYEPKTYPEMDANYTEMKQFRKTKVRFSIDIQIIHFVDQDSLVEEEELKVQNDDAEHLTDDIIWDE